MKIMYIKEEKLDILSIYFKIKKNVSCAEWLIFQYNHRITLLSKNKVYTEIPIILFDKESYTNVVKYIIK